jgi:NAD(P)-dependent dehydrogenase (short-subunit alcohol dehydrogenase family)
MSLRSIFHRALDRSIVASFDRTGFWRHQRRFSPIQPRSMTGPVLITGGTAGIGRAAAEQLGQHDISTILWGRSVDRGNEATAAVANSAFTSVDLADLEAVAEATRGLLDGPLLSAVVLNAGAMPLERTLSPQGHELMWASQVLGHTLLLRILHAAGRLAQARVVWVSSGGMYLQRLDLRDLRWDRSYERHTVYANAKRAQVMLNAHLATAWPDVWTAAMHPGWVDTAAVQHSMPVFRFLTAPILRNADEGADTIHWLVHHEQPGETGQFWFDRKAVPVHLVDRTRASDDQLDALVETVWAATDPFLEPACAA